MPASSSGGALRRTLLRCDLIPSRSPTAARARLDAAKNEAKPGGGGAAGKAERMGTAVMTIVCSVCKVRIGVAWVCTRAAPAFAAWLTAFAG